MKKILFIVVTLLILITGIVIGYIKWADSKRPEVQSQVKINDRNREGKQDATEASPRYKNLVEEENQEKADQAEETGKSSLDRLTRGQLTGEDDLLKKLESLQRALNRSDAESLERYNRIKKQINGLTGRVEKQTNENTIPLYIDTDGILHLSASAQKAEKESYDSLVSLLEVREKHYLDKPYEFSKNDKLLDAVEKQEIENEARLAKERQEQEAIANKKIPDAIPVTTDSLEYARLILAPNSDARGVPVSAVITGGKYHNFSLTSPTFKVNQGFISIIFDRFYDPDKKRGGKLKAYAVDINTRVGAIKGKRNYHVLSRLGGVSINSFIKGLGLAARSNLGRQRTESNSSSQEGSSTLTQAQIDALLAELSNDTTTDERKEEILTIIAGNIVTGGSSSSSSITEQERVTTKQAAAAALAEVGDGAASIIEEMTSRPTTTYVDVNTPISLFIYEPGRYE